MTFFEFQWANGREIVKGNTYEEACGKIKKAPSKILTGFLVRVREVTKVGQKLTDWGYWDGEQFWKHLKDKKKKRLFG